MFLLSVLLHFLWLKLVYSYSLQYQKICKFTVKGTEYIGHSKETTSNKFCQKWNSSVPHIVPPSIEDRNFPDGSKTAAKKYCRNPDNSETGPWCYTTSSTVVRESCLLSLCAYNSCQWTGLGIEYSGTKQVTVLNNECMAWSLVKPDMNEKIFDLGFPDGNRMLAHKYCRNPTADPNGPWCYVANMGFDLGLIQEYTKEYCDIPTCFDREDTFVVNGKIDSDYTHFSNIQTNGYYLNISIFLWQPDQWKDAKIKLALTLLPIPSSGQLIRKWDAGFEIIISNNETGATPIQEEEPSWEVAPTILKGTEWTNLTIEWSSGFIIMKYTEEKKYIFLHEYSENSNSMLGINEWKISHYSIVGSPAYIRVNGIENNCEQHITYTESPVRYYSIRYDKLTRVIDFHLRAESGCVIVLKQSPMSNILPEVIITLEGEDKMNRIGIRYYNKPTLTLSTAPKFDMLSYWNWMPFTISIVSSRLVMYVKKKSGIHSIFDVKNEIISTARWFTFGSNLTAHWTFYCFSDNFNIPEPQPPECSLSNKDLEYQGHQWTTISHKPCLPWVHESIKINESSFFLDRTKENAMNYCRNPTKNANGTFCYAYDLPVGLNIVEEKCLIRKCRLKDCRIAGTASDFAGSINKTITNRTCQFWFTNNPHAIPKILKTDDAFPERDLSAAKNYCRDPSGDISGPWCYTTDPDFMFDRCDVPDCTYPDECTILVSRVPKFRMYILPNWRLDGFVFRVKIWSPTKNAGVVIFIYPLNGEEYYKLSIGSNTNENISLHFYDKVGTEYLLKKISLFHVLSSGRWTGFNLKVSLEKILLYYENVPKTVFHWQVGNDHTIRKFYPVYLSYASSNYGFLGFNFKCEEQQILISREERQADVYYPLPLWLPENGPLLKELTLHFRGDQSVTIELSTLAFLGPDIKIKVNDGIFHDQISAEVKLKSFYKTVAVDRLDVPVLSYESWTEIKVNMKELAIEVKRNGIVVSNWRNPRPIRIYYFSILPNKGDMTWVANTEPPDLNGTLRNGGWAHWSSWNCSVTCGGGKGIRYRTCTNPKPSIFGTPCIGPSEEIGLCNHFECGELSPDLHEVINYRLRKYVYNIRVENLQYAHINCYKDILNVLKEETPHYVFYWIFNGIVITPFEELQNMDLDKSILSIPIVKYNNSGVYACMVKNNSTLAKVLQVTALVVFSEKFSEKAREGWKYKLKCNNKVLSHIYGHLEQSWLLNGTKWKAYKKTSITPIDILLIHPVMKNHSGIWECSIFQDELNLTWTTNWIYLKVLPRATFITHLLQDTFIGTLLGWINNELVILIILICFFLLVAAGAGYFAYFIIKIQRPILQKMFKNRRYSKVPKEDPDKGIKLKSVTRD